MALAYTKPFLMDVFLTRYVEILEKDLPADRIKYTSMIDAFYDKVGKDKFRVWASLDAAAIKEFKAAKKK